MAVLLVKEILLNQCYDSMEDFTDCSSTIVDQIYQMSPFERFSQKKWGNLNQFMHFIRLMVIVCWFWQHIYRKQRHIFTMTANNKFKKINTETEWLLNCSNTIWSKIFHLFQTQKLLSKGLWLGMAANFSYRFRGKNCSISWSDLYLLSVLEETKDKSFCHHGTNKLWVKEVFFISCSLVFWGGGGSLSKSGQLNCRPGEKKIKIHMRPAGFWLMADLRQDNMEHLLSWYWCCSVEELLNPPRKALIEQKFPLEWPLLWVAAARLFRKTFPRLFKLRSL